METATLSYLYYVSSKQYIALVTHGVRVYFY